MEAAAFSVKGNCAVGVKVHKASAPATFSAGSQSRGAVEGGGAEGDQGGGDWGEGELARPLSVEPKSLTFTVTLLPAV